MSTSRAVLGLAAAALLGLTACGDRGDEPDEGGGSAGSEPAPTVAVDCPTQLAEAAGQAPPADTAPPTWPELGDAVVCTYQLGTDGQPGWVLDGDPRTVPADVLSQVSDAVEELEPVTPDQMCTMDAGPRYLLVAASDEGTVALVAEDFGCRDVLFTSDPATVPAGEADTALAPSGRFGGTSGLAELLGGV